MRLHHLLQPLAVQQLLPLPPLQQHLQLLLLLNCQLHLLLLSLLLLPLPGPAA
jgi:hypothetical protein